MDADDRYDSLIVYYAERYGRNPLQIKRQIRAESNFDTNAFSVAGACGLFQFMAPTWEEWGSNNIRDAFDPEKSLIAHCRYMNWLEYKFNGDLERALAAYNFGIGNVQRGRRYPKETQEYVKKCLAFEEEKLTVVV